MNSMKRIISHALAASLVLFLAACSESGDGVLYKEICPLLRRHQRQRQTPALVTLLKLLQKLAASPRYSQPLKQRDWLMH